MQLEYQGVEALVVIHEEVRRGTPAQLIDFYRGKKIKGEIVILLDNR